LPGGRHTQAQVDEHTAKTLALVANRVPGDLSTDYNYNAKSHARLRSKVVGCWKTGISRCYDELRTFKGKLLGKDKKLAVVNHLEMLLIERFAALKEQMIESNLLHCCTSNMMTCGGDKSHEFAVNNDGMQTSHRSPACLCLAPTCIFDRMMQTATSKTYGQTTTAASGKFEHEHVVALSSMVTTFLLALLCYHAPRKERQRLVNDARDKAQRKRRWKDGPMW
jgi:hypothetical protein